MVMLWSVLIVNLGYKQDMESSCNSFRGATMPKTVVAGVGLLFMVVFLGITEVQGSDLGYRLQRDA